VLSPAICVYNEFEFAKLKISRVIYRLPHHSCYWMLLVLSIDHVNDSLVQCMLNASEQCMQFRRFRKPLMPSKPYWDQELEDALKVRKALRNREGTTKRAEKLLQEAFESKAG
jgi:hypothetical protein